MNIQELGGNNMGAITAILEISEPENFPKNIQIFTKLEQLLSIRGTDLYVLWSDLCNKDVNKVHQLVTNCPKEILEDACSRQDYSGRELVKEYLNN